jgi:hypothetical protein
MGWLVKIKFHVILWTIRSSLGLYVCCDTLDRLSGLETVCSFRGFQGEHYFSPLMLLFSKSTPKAIKSFLRSPKLK